MLTIPVGATVEWKNRDYDSDHTVTSDDRVTFNSGVISRVQLITCRYRKRFTELGTYQYHHSLHPELVGTIIVVPDGVVVLR